MIISHFASATGDFVPQTLSPAPTTWTPSIVKSWVRLCVGVALYILPFFIATGWSKKLTPFLLYGFLYALISSNIDRFSIFHCLNQENICNNTVAKDPTTPQVCRYTTLWNVSVLKATTENKTSSVTTHFKKLTTGNMFIVSVII